MKPIPLTAPVWALLKKVRRRVRQSRALAKRTFLMKRVKRGDFSHFTPPPVVVCSPGGVATTMVMEHISRFLIINSESNADQLKHIPTPLPLPTRTLFITGNPDAVIASLIRRGFASRQAANLGTFVGVFARGSLQRRALRRAVTRQIESFTAASGQGHVLTVDFDELWDSVTDIKEFLSIADDAFVEDFPPRRPRKSAPLNSSGTPGP
jgi:hypothetical protein